MLSNLDFSVLLYVGITLVVVGIIIIVAAIVFTSWRGAKESKAKAAGVIMIGPIPIIFGTDKKVVKEAMVLAIVLTVIVLIWMVLNYWLYR
jgi:uncharacterized protein (TIGR00304 family)